MQTENPFALFERLNRSYNQMLQPDRLRKIILKYANVTSCSNPLIDRKIEQAMDRVKDHLIYTWRTEVEILRQRIAELTERIQQLESENNFLRANAAPEVLDELEQRQIAQQKANGEVGSEED